MGEGRVNDAFLVSSPPSCAPSAGGAPWLWLVRPGALEAAAAFGVLLLDRLPGLLVALGAEVARHG